MLLHVPRSCDYNLTETTGGYPNSNSRTACIHLTIKWNPAQFATMFILDENHCPNVDFYFFLLSLPQAGNQTSPT